MKSVRGSLLSLVLVVGGWGIGGSLNLVIFWHDTTLSSVVSHNSPQVLPVFSGMSIFTRKPRHHQVNVRLAYKRVSFGSAVVKSMYKLWCDLVGVLHLSCTVFVCVIY